MLLGAIADDLTGATDLALMLAREGMRTIQVVGVPQEGFDGGDADAVVVALKSRTIPAEEAVALSVAATRRLLAAGAEQLVFKYCSTFDSTAAGNIGPVAEALLNLLDTSLTIACPAFPANGRTVYRGHLFVGDTLLSESPMKDHPLTPMKDANLLRVLESQTKLSLGLVNHDVVAQGSKAIRSAFASASEAGKRIVVVDAVTDQQLREIGTAAADMRLVTGGSGIAIGLPENFRNSGKLVRGAANRAFAAPAGPSIILAGSCSTATRRQIAKAIHAGLPAFKFDPREIAENRVTAGSIARWIEEQTHPTPLVYSSADPEEVRAAQQELGGDRAGKVVEDILSDVAALLLHRGYRRFLVAGGETSGAVVQGLGVTALLIGPEIDPGVPWTISHGEDAGVALALKSGNFGTDDFFLKAWDRLG